MAAGLGLLNWVIIDQHFAQRERIGRLLSAVAHKSALSSARIESDSTWVSFDGGPKLWVPPFGPLKRGLTEFMTYVKAAVGTHSPPPPERQ